VKDVVSKIRAKKTKKREKQAGKSTRRQTSLKDNLVIGLLITIVLWILAMGIIASDDMIQGSAGAQFVLPFVGDAGILLVGLLATGLFLGIVRPQVLHNNSMILLLSLISLIALFPAKALLYLAETAGLIPTEIAGFLLPFAMAPLLATILVDSTVGIALGTWASLAIAVMAGRSFPLLFTGIIATVIAAETARNVRTRAKVFRIGLVIGLSETTCVFAMTTLNWGSSSLILVLHQAGACLISGFLSAVVALLILPVFEALFDLTTDMTLLELSDLGHPLLQRLAIEAPGTYHHSLVVASLAQAAADKIGANALLARVSSYFHDVGKLTKPEFFAENIQLRANPHDDLPPSMSTLVITSHVKEGVSLAMLHKLPRPIIDVIREHHGSSLLSYFHHKAKTQVEGEPDNKQEGNPANDRPKVGEEDFRYTGPKPSSRESAIICLADTVEAASRSMKKTTPGHIEGLVNDLVNARILDDQLSGCSLTLSELTRIKHSFIFTLTNMLHGRLPYPKDEGRDKQQARAPQSQQAESKETGTVPDGTS